LVSAAWVTSVLPSLPCLVIFEISVKIVVQGSVSETFLREECVSNFSGWSQTMKKCYLSGIFLVIFVIPLCAMFTLYTHMLMQLRDNTRNTQRVKIMEMEDLKHKVNIMNMYYTNYIISRRFPVSNIQGISTNSST
jgi:hypothetical protein